MICPLCSKKMYVDKRYHPPRRLIGPYIISQPPDGGEIEVCGQCFLLVNILETLKEIKDGIAGRPK